MNSVSPHEYPPNPKEIELEVILVDWDSPTDKDNPKNWKKSKKWLVTVLISLFTLMSPMSSSMIAPAASQVQHDLHLNHAYLGTFLTSIFVLGYAFGPLIFGPLSQLFGRSRVVQAANCIYLAFNTACAFARNKEEILAFRFFAGVGGSAPLVIGGGVVSDLWSVDERGRAVTMYSLAPLLGPIIGPVAGAWIASKSTWKWVFWSTSIADGVLQVIATIWLYETHAPTLLKRKASRLRKDILKTGQLVQVMTVYQAKKENGSILTQLLYPLTLLTREPIAQLLGIYLAYIYGLVYLILTSIPGIFFGIYRESLGIAGLHYIAFGIGLYTGSQTCSMFLDPIYSRLRSSNKGVGRPEFRTPLMVPGTLLIPVGLLITGWTVKPNILWIVPDVGLLLTGIGIAINWQSITTYIIDTYTVRAAPAIGALALLRSLIGFALPLAATPMYEKLGYGKGNSILAGCAIALGCPIPWIIWRYGFWLRGRSTSATHV